MIATVALLTAEEALAAGEARVGGKAIGLARLAAAGATVPWWVVLPVEHAGADDAALSHALDAVLAGRGPVAVRSSVVGEDSATHSHAGVFDSFLHVEGTDAVLAAVRRCLASASSERVRAYRGDDVPAMAVVIQEFVEGEVSGVLFTRNPISGAADEALISATWGLAEGVVSGACDTDEIVWAHEGRERSVVVSTKETAIRPAPGGTAPVAVADELQAVRCLDTRAVDDLGRRALAIADALGAPQDIEWTIRGGEPVFLQARPITTKADPLGPRRIVWDNSNIQESFNGVTTPLTFSVAVRAYASVYEQTLRVLGVPEPTLAAHRPVFRTMIGLVEGRVYYSIENWYRCLLLLPGFGRSKADMERMMGLEDPVDLVDDAPANRRALVRVGLRLARALRRLERDVPRFLETFAQRTAHIDRDHLRTADLDELLTLADRLDEQVVGDWTVPIVNDIHVMTMTGKARKLVARAVGEDEADEAIAGLLSGEEAIESMQPTRRLLAMAQAVGTDPALALEPPGAALTALREGNPAFDADVTDFIARYGDRCMGEMKLETISLRQDPTFLVRVLRNFAARPDLDPETLEARERERREAYEARVMAPLNRLQRRRLRRALASARAAVKWRENMRLSRTRFVGLYREIYLAAGERLHEAGLLDAPRDVLYLTREDLTAFHEGTSVTADLAGLARLRRAEFAGYEDRELPNHFETVGTPYAGRRVTPRRAARPDGPALQGIGCSAGVVDGELRVVLHPDDDLDVNGRILTTVRTDPGWTPLFPSAAGLLIERGSTLSHSAVLAREFGIPCVVGIPDLLKIVRDGERVRLDGGTGVVERLDA